MKDIVIAIGADHHGFAFKENLKQLSLVADFTITWIDVGADNDKRSDYPLFAIRVAQYIQEKRADFGILLCGSGIGMAIAANRFYGIFAGVAWNAEIARQAREDDNVNVLVLPADYIDSQICRAMVMSWLGAEFKHARYEQRIAMIDALETSK